MVASVRILHFLSCQKRQKLKLFDDQSPGGSSQVVWAKKERDALRGELENFFSAVTWINSVASRLEKFVVFRSETKLLFDTPLTDGSRAVIEIAFDQGRGSVLELSQKCGFEVQTARDVGAFLFLSDGDRCLLDLLKDHDGRCIEHFAQSPAVFEWWMQCFSKVRYVEMNNSREPFNFFECFEHGPGGVDVNKSYFRMTLVYDKLN